MSARIRRAPCGWIAGANHNRKFSSNARYATEADLDACGLAHGDLGQMSWRRVLRTPGAIGRQLRQRPRPMLTSMRLLDFILSANFVASSRASWVNCFRIAFNFKTAALE